MPLDKIEKMRSWLLEQSVSLDKPVGDDEGRVLGEVLEDPDREEVSPTGELEWEALTAEVETLLGELRPIEADILRQRFGLGTEQELTLKEIGDKYNYRASASASSRSRRWPRCDARWLVATF